jgi:hypothetical protein
VPLCRHARHCANCKPVEKELATSLFASQTRKLLKGRKMLKITRTANGEVVFTLSGRMDTENLAELETLVAPEAEDRRIVLDLRDLTLVDQEAVSFLKRCEADGIQLKNCPAYIREWITREWR